MKKSVFTALISSIVVATAIGATPLKSQAITFDFSFDNTPDNFVATPPFVGTGTFSFDGDPGTGSFALTSLKNYNFSFQFADGSSFTTSQIVTPLANIQVRITDNGSARLIHFGGSRGGSLGGSIDFIDTTSGNTFRFFGNFLPRYRTETSTTVYDGNYRGIARADSTPVPEPISMLGVLVASLAGAVAKSKKQSQPSLEKVN